MYPKFTLKQHNAILKEVQSQLHPRPQDMSIGDLLRRVGKLMIATNDGPPPPASFVGNLTAVTLAGNDGLLLAQQSDCSLTLRDTVYTFNLTGPSFSYQMASSTPHYEQVLHAAAGLTTKGGSYPAGCGNAQVGVRSRYVVFAGTTTSGLRVSAAEIYDLTTSQNQVGVSVSKGDDTFEHFSSIGEVNDTQEIATADLNGDGNGDLVLVNNPPMNSGTASVSISLGKADGSFPVPTEIPLTGSGIAYSAVIDDFNGDGKKDIVVSSLNSNGSTYSINFLAGNGDGTFQALKSYTVTPPKSVQSNGPYSGLISADLRGSGHKDLITGNGIVLYGKGDGTFTQASTTAFFAEDTTSEEGPNVVAADLNKDGKLDLAVDNGETIAIYLGKGDGTFTAHATYSTIASVGYLVAQDIDGDGNIDLFSGPGNYGTLGGDKFQTNQAYALMGNGDGSFRGAASLPFVNTGNNLADLNGDKTIDAIAVNADSSFTSYLNDGKGNFTVKATLVTTPVEIAGKSYTFNGIDSFDIADVNGDGHADLIYIAANFSAQIDVNGYPRPGVFIALGKGDGSFETPVFVSNPTFGLSSNPRLGAAGINGVRVVDTNRDGKLDLVYTYTSSSPSNTNLVDSGIEVQLGNGDGTFQTTVHPSVVSTTSTSPSPGGLQIGLVGDVNNDGAPDVFALSGLSFNSLSFTAQILVGNGDGTFKAPATIAGVMPTGESFGTERTPMALADMNGDGRPDLIVLQQDPTTQNQVVAIALGNGDGTFKAPGLTTFSAQFLGGGLAVADFNGDGRLDVATTSFIDGFGNGISFGNGDGTLQVGGDTSTGLVTTAQGFVLNVGGAATTADLNGDGKPDLLGGVTELLSQAAVVMPATSTTSLTASASSIQTGQSVTFTAIVVGASGATAVPSGTVSLMNGTTVLGSGTLDGTGKATFSTKALAAGSYEVTAVYGGDANFTASTSSAVSLTVTTPPPVLIATATGLTASAASIVQGGSLTLSATVTPASGSGVPSGTVSFADGGTALGTGTLDGTGKATYSTSSLAVGAHSIKASYAGDSTYAVSASSAVTVTVTAPVAAGDFTLTLGSSSGTASLSSPTVTSIVSVTPTNGFSQSVALGCSGAPANATCSVAPGSVTPNGTTAATATLTVTTDVATSAPSSSSARAERIRTSGTAGPGVGGGTVLALLGGGGVFAFSFRRLRRRGWASLPTLLVIGLLGVLGVLGCGGTSGKIANKTPSGTYAITVSGVSGTTTHTASFSLIVQ